MLIYKKKAHFLHQIKVSIVVRSIKVDKHKKYPDQMLDNVYKKHSLTIVALSSIASNKVAVCHNTCVQKEKGRDEQFFVAYLKPTFSFNVY